MSESLRLSDPPMTGIHHFSSTVSDVETSAQWYERVFGMGRAPATFPHHHEANVGEGFDERRNGLDHISSSVVERADLDAWTVWLDERGVAHSGVQDVEKPMPFSTIVLRDPDNMQLELIDVAG